MAVAGGTGTVGRYVVARSQEAGHEALALSRSRGIDVRSGEGLAAALNGVDVVVDATNADTIEQGPATQFFTDVAGTLHRVGAEMGVRHLVILSIVGVDRSSYGYYAAKVEQERAAMGGPVPATVMRATQFHEFPAQMVARTRQGAQAYVRDVRVQTVAARTVADVLIEIAEGAPAGRTPDLAGPEQASLADLARAFVDHRGAAITVRSDPNGFAGDPPDVLLPGGDARTQGPRYADWLLSEDAAALTL